MTRSVALPALLALLFVTGERYADAGEPLTPRGEPTLGLPRLGLFAVSSAAQVRLGRKLSFDARLSRDGSVGCVSCHNAKLAFPAINGYCRNRQPCTHTTSFLSRRSA